VELQIEKLGRHHHARPKIEAVIDQPSPAGAADTAVAEAKINYLKMMTMTLLHELSSLTEGRREPATARVDLKGEVLRFESELIRCALQTTHGQQRRAARLLGTNATTLNTKLKRLGIEIDDDPADGFAITPSSEFDFSGDGQHLTFAEAMCRYEISLIQNALTQTGGNQSRAARLLGLPITTLNSKIKKFKIDLSGYSDPATDFKPLPAYHRTPERSPIQAEG
jgi:DNA-binding NtrC family response regulator